jgi:signal transduction histidine kinase
MNKKYSILYVDDETSNLNVFKNTFRRDYHIFTAESAREGLDILDREHIDLILSDQRMPEMTGVDFLKNVMEKYPEPTRILITAYTDFSALKDAVNEAKIFQYIQKPWDEDDIKQTIDSALEIYTLRQKNIQLTEELAGKNKELEKLNQDLIELDKIKFQFLHIIAHEIRTPLNGLVGATFLFKNAVENDENEEYGHLFGILETSTQRLTRFLLLAERITALRTQGYRINPERVNLNGLIRNTMKEIEKKPFGKHIRFETNLCVDEGCDSMVEKQLIEACLYEVMNNAVKYSEDHGIVSVTTSTSKDSFTVEIADHGSGFTPYVLENIFSPFIADREITKEGMGLNMSLVKLIMDAHQGTISVSNHEQEGAVVKLDFKLHKS